MNKANLYNQLLNNQVKITKYQLLNYNDIRMKNFYYGADKLAWRLSSRLRIRSGFKLYYNISEKHCSLFDLKPL